MVGNRHMMLIIFGIVLVVLGSFMVISVLLWLNVNPAWKKLMINSFCSSGGLCIFMTLLIVSKNLYPEKNHSYMSFTYLVVNPNCSNDNGCLDRNVHLRKTSRPEPDLGHCVDWSLRCHRIRGNSLSGTIRIKLTQNTT